MFNAAHPRITMPVASEPRAVPGANGNGQTKPAESPKENGRAAPADPAASEGEGRDAKGRFAKGNKEGFGNPFSRQVAEARQIVLDCVTPEELRAVTQAMLKKAKEGDVAAAKVIFEYTIGRPAKPVEPDRLDREEMEYFKDVSRMLAEATRMVVGVEAWLPLTMLRSSWPAITKKVSKDYLVPGLLRGLPGHEEPGRPPVTGANGAKTQPVTVDNGAAKLAANGKLPAVGG